MISSEYYFYLCDLWKKAVFKIWDHRCAFPGCINIPFPYHIRFERYFLHQLNPLNGILSCKYHRAFVLSIASILIDHNPNYPKFAFNFKRTSYHIQKEIFPRIKELEKLTLSIL